MSVADVDGDFFQRFLEVEGGGEGIGGGEEDLALHDITAGGAVVGQGRGDAEDLGDLPGEEDIVWRLPPALATSREDEAAKAKFVEIGESNRMTLLFKKG